MPADERTPIYPRLVVGPSTRTCVTYGVAWGVVCNPIDQEEMNQRALEMRKKQEVRNYGTCRPSSNIISLKSQATANGEDDQEDKSRSIMDLFLVQKSTSLCK